MIGPTRCASHAPPSRRTRKRSAFPDPARQRRGPVPSTTVHWDASSTFTPAESTRQRVKWRTRVSSPAGRRTNAGRPSCVSTWRNSVDTGTTGVLSRVGGVQNHRARVDGGVPPARAASQTARMIAALSARAPGDWATTVRGGRAQQTTRNVNATTARPVIGIFGGLTPAPRHMACARAAGFGAVLGSVDATAPCGPLRHTTHRHAPRSPRPYVAARPRARRRWCRSHPAPMRG